MSNYPNLNSNNSSISTGTLTVNGDTIWNSNIHTGYTYTSYDYTPTTLEEQIMKILESDPELVSKVIVELRKKKINKIRNK